MAPCPSSRLTPHRARPAGRRRPDRVGSILAAAEETAERIRAETETRARERIAEGKRAADYRVTAAEEEAAEILEAARADAERVVREASERDELARTTATSEALMIVARAQESADATLAEQPSRRRPAAARRPRSYTRELIWEARQAAQEVRSEGMELVANMRQMGDSLRANAERILRDVQGVHSQLVAKIERVERATRARDSPASRAGRTRSLSRGARRRATATVPDVPEFIPRR